MSSPLRPKAGRLGAPQEYGISEDLEQLLPWSWANERLRDSRNYWVCTSRPDGRPHAMPVWGLWLDDGLYFSTARASRKARNLAENPYVGVHLESGDEVVILEGRVTEVEKEQEIERMSAKYEAKYGILPPLKDPRNIIYRLRPEKAFAWREKDFPKSATRWEF